MCVEREKERERELGQSHKNTHKIKCMSFFYSTFAVTTRVDLAEQSNKETEQ